MQILLKKSLGGSSNVWNQEFKEKSKIQLDEMFDAKPVGKTETQKKGKEGTQQASHMDIQKNMNSAVHQDGNMDVQTAAQPSGLHNYFPTTHLPSHTENQQPRKLETHPESNQEVQLSRQPPLFSIKQQSPKIATYKMTFNLTEEIYKAFNDLYANRMLQGRKTEKSELICEAIQWLIKMENL